MSNHLYTCNQSWMRNQSSSTNNLGWVGISFVFILFIWRFLEKGYDTLWLQRYRSKQRIQRNKQRRRVQFCWAVASVGLSCYWVGNFVTHALKFDNNSDHPHPPHLQKICPQNMLCKRGSVWHNSRLESRDFYRKIWHTDPLLWHTNPPLLSHMNPFFYWGWGWSLICWKIVFIPNLTKEAGIQKYWFFEDSPPQTKIRGVPTTPDPNTSAKVSRYKWEAYR